MKPHGLHREQQQQQFLRSREREKGNFKISQEGTVQTPWGGTGMILSLQSLFEVSAPEVSMERPCRVAGAGLDPAALGSYVVGALGGVSPQKPNWLVWGKSSVLWQSNTGPVGTSRTLGGTQDPKLIGSGITKDGEDLKDH